MDLGDLRSLICFPPTPVFVTLTTDFGTRDGYVAAMKGVMLRAAPSVQFIDVTHQVPAQDVMAAAFILRQFVPYAPAGSVHLAVVDPGVGTDRRAIAADVDVGGEVHRFVGPDNGLLALVAGHDDVHAAVELDREERWRTGAPSSTFHGRDIFGPVAAQLATGLPLREVGTPVSDLATLHWPLPHADREGIRGMVLHIDRFGNCLTNITAADIDRARCGRAFKAYAGSAVVTAYHPTYGHVAMGAPVMVFGSSAHLEIAVRGGHAASLLSVERGDPVTLVFETRRTPRVAKAASLA